MKKILVVLICLGGLAAAMSAPRPAPASAGTNPLTAGIATMAGRTLDGYRSDRTRRCSGRPQRGALELQSWLARNVRGVSWGIYNCRRVRIGSSLSLHAEGRAVDWHLDRHKTADRRAAYGVIDAFLAPDTAGRRHALARRMGVQELIYDCKIWTAHDGNRGMRHYSGCRRGASDTIAHRDHVHIGLNWRGAKARSTFWRLVGR
jgi:hypothetical protein